MSHVVAIETEILDLVALEAACGELGLKYQEGKKDYRWYGLHVGDYPMPSGMTADQLGHCDHAIVVPGSAYEIGVIKNPDRGSYRLIFDFFGSGKVILEKLGPKCEKLVQIYGVTKTTMEAERRGFQARRENQADGSVKVLITKRA